jgi:hypothetical protein
MADGFDWREQEAKFAGFDQFRVLLDGRLDVLSKPDCRRRTCRQRGIKTLDLQHFEVGGKAPARGSIARRRGP